MVSEITIRIALNGENPTITTMQTDNTTVSADVPPPPTMAELEAIAADSSAFDFIPPAVPEVETTVHEDTSLSLPPVPQA